MRVVGALLALYLLYLGVLFVLQRRILYPGRGFPVPDGVAERVAGLEVHWLPSSSGRVESWYLPPLALPASGRSPAVIFAHGNGEAIDHWPEPLAGFRRLGLGVLLVEYPGYGRSEGAPSRVSIGEVMLAAYDQLARRPDVDPERIVGHGRSLGGGAVCDLARKRDLAALILESTFTSVRSFARRRLIPAFALLDRFDNLDLVRGYPGPVLVIHGRRDDLIPYDHGVSLAAAATNGRLITYDCGHNDCPPSWSEYWRDVGAFLAEHGVVSPPG